MLTTQIIDDWIYLEEPFVRSTIHRLNTNTRPLAPSALDHLVTRAGSFVINTVLDEAAGPIPLLQNWNPAVKK